MKDEKQRVEACIPIIIQWYARKRRDLPWRQEPTPYHVWLSEIMLQQTRIEAVIPYYERFLRDVPSVDVLSRIQDERLMKLWEGLGYYSRVRNLKKAAVQLMESYGGELPRTAAELKKLPGIGEYTAGAIASIAYGAPEPAVDGNVLRVMSRVLASRDDIMAAKTKKHITELLRQSYPVGAEASLLTEGIMELGETICIPNGEANCHQCPIKDHCLAFRNGLQDQLPVRSLPKERKVQKRTVLLLWKEGCCALRKRPPSGLLAGLWEFPNEEGWLDGKEIRVCAEKMGLSVRNCHSSVAYKHVFTHVEWHMRSYFIECTGENDHLVWVKPEEIRNNYSIPTAFRCFLHAAEEKENGVLF